MNHIESNIFSLDTTSANQSGLCRLKELTLFCMRECYSADIYCRAYYRRNEESFHEAQITGFDYFEGAPKRVMVASSLSVICRGLTISSGTNFTGFDGSRRIT